MKETSKFIDSIYLRFFKVIAFFSPSATWYYEFSNIDRSLDQPQCFNELLRLVHDVFLSIKWVSFKISQVINGISAKSIILHGPLSWSLKLISSLNKNNIISKEKMVALGDPAVINTASRLALHKFQQNHYNVICFINFSFKTWIVLFNSIFDVKLLFA